MPLTTVRLPLDSGPSIPVPPLSSPALARHAPDVADRLGLTLDVGEQVPVAIPLQPFLDQRPEDDLKAHRELERGHCLPRKDPGAIQDVLGKNEEDSDPIREHHTTSTVTIYTIYLLLDI